MDSSSGTFTVASTEIDTISNGLYAVTTQTIIDVYTGELKTTATNPSQH